MVLEGGPWGIVIVISAFMIQFLVFGLVGAIGMYNIEFLDYFQVSAKEVSLIIALNCGVFLGSGPIVSFLMSKFSYRKVVLFGSVLVVLGLLSVPLFPNFYVMYLTLGITVGFGSSCAYIPSHTLSGLYYHKYRSLATGVVTSGSGLGLGVMPVLAAFFIDTYGWKGSFIMFAGLCLHLLIFAGLLRDPPPLPNAKEDNDTLLNDDDNDGDIHENGVNVEIIVDDDDREKQKNGLQIEIFDGTTVDKSTEEYQELYLDGNGSMVASDEEKGRRNHLNKNGGTVSRPDTSRHIYIFKDGYFVVYFVNNILWNMSTSMLASFAPEYLNKRGFEFDEVSWLFGGFGYGCFAGGILGGVLGNIKGVNRIVLFCVVCFLVGVFTLALPLGDGIVYVAIVMIITGLIFGVILGLLMIVLADLVGVESLGNGMGYLMLGNGMGTLSGPVFAGMVIDSTDKTVSSMYLSGFLSLASGLVMCLIPLHRFFKKCQKTTP